MKIMPRHSMMHNLFNRRRATTLSGFISAINLFVGIFVLIFIIVVQDSRTGKNTSYQFETNMDFVQINNGAKVKEILPKSNSKRRSLNDYHFEIDYTIQQAICQPVSIFHGKNAMNTIRALTAQELSGVLNPNAQIFLNLLHINGVLKSSERLIETNGGNKTEKLLCSYVLELTVVINFPSTCDNECQQRQIDTLTTNRNLFGDLPNSSLKFSLPDVTLPDAPVVFFIHQFAIYRTTKYLEKAAFVQNIATGRFASTKNYHSNINQSSVSMAIKEKSLFVLKRGLEMLDSSSIYVSFLSLSIPNLYLRHQDGVIKLAKNDQSTLFRQDATFKLTFDQRNEIVAFQAVNIPTAKFYISLSGDSEPTLILAPCDAESTERMDPKSLFKFIVAS